MQYIYAKLSVVGKANSYGKARCSGKFVKTTKCQEKKFRQVFIFWEGINAEIVINKTIK